MRSFGPNDGRMFKTKPYDIFQSIPRLHLSFTPKTMSVNSMSRCAAEPSHSYYIACTISHMQNTTRLLSTFKTPSVDCSENGSRKLGSPCHLSMQNDRRPKTVCSETVFTKYLVKAEPLEKVLKDALLRDQLLGDEPGNGNHSQPAVVQLLGLHVLLGRGVGGQEAEGVCESRKTRSDQCKYITQSPVSHVAILPETKGEGQRRQMIDP